MKKYGLLPPLFLVAACSHVDTGEIDYRRAEAAPALSDSIKQYKCPAEDGPLKVTGKVTVPREKQCPGLLPAKLFRKSAGLGDPIAKDDVYSVRLDHGLVAYMTEAPFSFRRLWTGKNPLRKIGEIVVLANVFEFSPSSTDENDASRFLDFTEFDQAKVIYYNPDVEEGQDLNFSNIPLQAPMLYNGRPVAFQIIVMELDRVSDPMRNLLKQLSLMGQESNVLPGGAASSLLLELGTSLLSQNNDDIIFEYRFVLDPGSKEAGPNANSAPFEAGRYVFRRVDERMDDQVWRNLRLDYNTGKLMWVNPTVADNVAFNHDTYFTLNVIRHPDAAAAATFGFRAMDTLGQEIEDAAAERDLPFEVLAARAEEKVLRMRATKWGGDLADAWDTASSRFRVWARRHPLADDELKSGECKLKDRIREEAELGEIRARNAAIDFVRLFQQARAAKTDKDDQGVERDLFPETDQRKILDSMSSFFVPFSDDDDAAPTVTELTDIEAFATRFIIEDTIPFQNAMQSAALRKYQPSNCDDMIAAGIADPGDAVSADAGGGT